MTSWRLQSNYSSTVTLHGGPVVLRPVRATPCCTPNVATLTWKPIWQSRWRRELKPRPHQQQCTSNIVECYKFNDSFDSVECCFDIFADFGNNVEGNFVLSTKSKQIEHVQFVSTLSKGRNFTINSFDIVAVCVNKVERSFDNVACSFDIVAGVDGALVRPLCLRLLMVKLFYVERETRGCYWYRPTSRCRAEIISQSDGTHWPPVSPRTVPRDAPKMIDDRV